MVDAEQASPRVVCNSQCSEAGTQTDLPYPPQPEEEQAPEENISSLTFLFPQPDAFVPLQIATVVNPEQCLELEKPEQPSVAEEAKSASFPEYLSPSSEFKLDEVYNQLPPSPEAPANREHACPPNLSASEQGLYDDYLKIIKEYCEEHEFDLVHPSDQLLPSLLDQAKMMAICISHFTKYTCDAISYRKPQKTDVPSLDSDVSALRALFEARKSLYKRNYCWIRDILFGRVDLSLKEFSLFFTTAMTDACKHCPPVYRYLL